MKESENYGSTNRARQARKGVQLPGLPPPGTAGAGGGPAGTTGGGCRSGAGAGYSGGSEPMKKQLIVTTVYLFFLLALVALIEIVWNQEPEQPAIETPAATTTPAPTPTGPLTIQITGLEGAESIDDVWAVITIPEQ